MFLIGMWSSSFYLGNFLGPTVGGLLVDAFGFAWTTIVFSFLYCFMIIVNLCELSYAIVVKKEKLLIKV